MGASLKAGRPGGGRRGRARRHAPMAEINVTPFVDVMLVLLIIFMDRIAGRSAVIQGRQAA
jgi:biopolymer transport protein TolR